MIIRRRGLLGLVLARVEGNTLAGADLHGLDLVAADLRGADLRGANLRNARLTHADLRGADLRGADLCGADLRGPLWRSGMGATCERGQRPQDAASSTVIGWRVSRFEGADFRGAVYNAETRWPRFFSPAGQECAQRENELVPARAPGGKGSEVSPTGTSVDGR